MKKDEFIGVDFDRTLAFYETGTYAPGKLGEPIAETVKTVKAWLANGFNVKVFTARNPEEWNAISNWTETYLDKRLEVTNVKSHKMAVFYDDKARMVVPNVGTVIYDYPNRIPIGEKGYQVYLGGFYKEIRIALPDNRPKCDCGKVITTGVRVTHSVKKEWVNSWQVKELNIIGHGKDEYFYEYEYDTGNGYGDIRKDIDRIDIGSVFVSREMAERYIEGLEKV